MDSIDALSRSRCREWRPNNGLDSFPTNPSPCRGTSPQNKLEGLGGVVSSPVGPGEELQTNKFPCFRCEQDIASDNVLAGKVATVVFPR